MGFKWFKARIRMNRMPAHSSAVAGSYRTTMFDASNNEFISNNNQGNDGQTKSEPKSSIRPLSMPTLNNPLIGVTNGDDDLEYVQSSNNDITRSLSTRTLEESEYTPENMYSGLGLRTPVVFEKQKLKQDLDQNIAKIPSKPRKKGKAPTPEVNVSKSSASTSDNGTSKFLTMKKERKLSQDSDIDV